MISTVEWNMIRLPGEWLFWSHLSLLYSFYMGLIMTSSRIPNWLIWSQHLPMLGLNLQALWASFSHRPESWNFPYGPMLHGVAPDGKLLLLIPNPIIFGFSLRWKNYITLEDDKEKPFYIFLWHYSNFYKSFNTNQKSTVYIHSKTTISNYYFNHITN